MIATSDVLLYFLAILVPPIPVFLKTGESIFSEFTGAYRQAAVLIS